MTNKKQSEHHPAPLRFIQPLVRRANQQPCNQQRYNQQRYNSQNHKSYSRFRWPRGLRRGSAAARLLGLRFRIPPGTSMSCLLNVVCVLSGTDRSLRRADHSSREVLPNVACLIKQCDLKTSMMIRPRTTRAVMKKRETNRKTGVRTTNWVTETLPHVGIMLTFSLLMTYIHVVPHR
jgi:hypothetical protein